MGPPFCYVVSVKFFNPFNKSEADAKVRQFYRKQPLEYNKRLSFSLLRPYIIKPDTAQTKVNPYDKRN